MCPGCKEVTMDVNEKITQIASTFTRREYSWTIDRPVELVIEEKFNFGKDFPGSLCSRQSRLKSFFFGRKPS